MPTAIPPWPPDDWQAPQPYDQRGACWPPGPCAPTEKLQMRYTAIGRVEAGGWINDGWGLLKTGCLFVPDLTGPSSKIDMLYFTGINVPPIPQTFLRFWLDDAGLWQVEFQWWTDLIGPIPAWCIAEGGMTESSCGSSTLILPVVSATPLTSPPQFVELQGVLWYQASPYPIVGF